MLYKFKSSATGDVVMTEAVGERLLRILGKDPGPQGIVLPEQMPAAIAALEAAIAAEEAERARLEAEAAAEGTTPPPRPAVSLRQRAWPLVEMMRRAHAADREIVWGV